MSIENLTVRMFGDVSNYVAAVKQAQGATASLTTTILGLAGIGGAMEAFRRSISLSAEAEQMRISFSVMLQSVEKGKQLTADIQKFAAETPLNQGGIQAAAKMLLQFGVVQNDLIPTIRRLGDVANGQQDKMMSLALAFGQAKAAGRLMGGELLQMINAGFNPLQEISRTTGKSMAVLKEDMEHSKISVEMVEEAFRTATGAGGRFNDGMKEASKGLSGLFSTMKDDADAMLRTFGDAAVAVLDLKENIKAASEWFQTITEYVKNIDQSTKDWVSTSVKWGAILLVVSAALSALSLALGVLKFVLSPIAGLWNAFMVSAHASASAAGPATAGMVNMAAAALALKAALVVLAAYATVKVAWAIVDSTQEMQDFKNETARAEILSKAQEGTGDRRTKKFIEYATQLGGDAGDPNVTKKTLEDQLKFLEEEDKRSQQALDKAKKRFDEQNGLAKKFVGNYLGPWGVDRAAETQTDKNLLATSEAAAKAAKASVETIREELKKFDEKKTSGEAQKAVAGINQELKTLIASAGEINKLEAEVAKTAAGHGFMASQDQSNLRGLLRYKDYIEENVKFRKSLESSNEELSVHAQTFRMASEDAKVYKLALEAATTANRNEAEVDERTARGLANARGMANMMRDLETRKKLEEAATHTKDTYADPADKLKKELDDLDKMLGAGLIDTATYGRAVTKMSESMGKFKEDTREARHEIQAFDGALTRSAAGNWAVRDYLRATDRRSAQRALDIRGAAGVDDSFSGAVKDLSDKYQRPGTGTKDERVPALLERIAKTLEASSKVEKKLLPGAGLASVIGGFGLGAPQ